MMDAPEEKRITAVVADGGTVGNGSTGPIFVMAFAFRHIDENDQVAEWGSGIVEPNQMNALRKTSHTAEIWAIIMALRDLPQGWSGKLLTDTRGAAAAVLGSELPADFPFWLREYCRGIRTRLGEVEIVSVGSHPTVDERRRGVMNDGWRLVSEHHIWCDQECNRLKYAYNMQCLGELARCPSTTGAKLQEIVNA